MRRSVIMKKLVFSFLSVLFLVISLDLISSDKPLPAGQERDARKHKMLISKVKIEHKKFYKQDVAWWINKLPFNFIKFCKETEHGIKYRDKDKSVVTMFDECANAFTLKELNCSKYEDWVNGTWDKAYAYTTKQCLEKGGVCLTDKNEGFGYCVDCNVTPADPDAEPTCIDGKQNQDEEGIDCGGIKCQPCLPFCVINQENSKKPAELYSECGKFTNSCKPGVDNVILAYSCSTGDEEHQCPPPIVDVKCPKGEKCYNGVCSQPTVVCEDSDPTNDPNIFGHVYDSNHVYAEDICDLTGNLIQVDCSCPNQEEKTSCAGGTVSTVVYSSFSAEAQTACIEKLTQELGGCPVDFCYNEKIQGHMECPTEICLWPVATYKPCPNGSKCIDGVCKTEPEAPPPEEYDCQRFDENGPENPGGGYIKEGFWPPEYDICNISVPIVVGEKQCPPNDGWYLFKECPSGQICFKEEGKGAVCVPKTGQSTCERIDENSSEPGGGHIQGIDDFGVAFSHYDYCDGMLWLNVVEKSCEKDSQGMFIPKNVACPAGYACHDGYKVAAKCMPIPEGKCERNDSNGPENFGGGSVSCINLQGNQIKQFDSCTGGPSTPLPEKQVVEFYCKSNDPKDCKGNSLVSSLSNCPDGYYCKQVGEWPYNDPAICAPIDYDKCVRYDASPDPNNPTAGYVLLTKEGVPDKKIYDVCQSNDLIIGFYCPDQGPFTETMIQDSSKTIDCAHNCMSLEVNSNGTPKYPGKGYCKAMGQ